MADVLDYIFEFSSEAAALGDAVVGPYFTPGRGLSRDVLLFAREINSGIPLSNYWCMITKPASVDQSLSTHPNIELVNNRTRQVAGNSSLIIYNLTNDAAQLQIMVSGAGIHTVNGFVPPFPVPVSPITGHDIEVDVGVPLEWDIGQPIEYQ